MLVIEKYKDEIKDILTDSLGSIAALARIKDKIFDGKCYNSKQTLIKLLEEYKESYKLTKYELETLKLLSSRGYQLATRVEGNDYVNFFQDLSVEDELSWAGEISTETSLFYTFNFIEEGRIYKISEILENCEVEE